jgi:septal ring factor EnvC (AmiA/AmiB activator)
MAYAWRTACMALADPEPWMIRSLRVSQLPGALTAALLLAAGAASAQSRSDAASDLLRQRDLELETARADQKKAIETEKKLRAEIDALGEDRLKFTQALIEGAAKVKEIEKRLSENEARIKPLQDQELALRASLDERKAVIAEVLAALQRIGRRPPPAIMASPEDALQSVRTAILLGAVLPEMRQRAQTLAADLSELVRIRNGIAAEKTRLTADLSALAEGRQRMSVLIEERKKKQAESEKALERERQNALALSRQVDGLTDLIGRLEQGISATAKAARNAARLAEEPKPGERPDLAALKDPGRLEPAVAFASLKGHLPLPANGVKIREFGAADGLGGAEKGISVATRPGAQVTAPSDGWVVYAGPFRSYGQLLILNAGGGYHVLLAGMDRISVDLGQFVLTGEPVGIMGSSAQVAAAIPIASSQSVLYVEFRKDGTPVDPGPWWATSESEKVRG